MDESEWKKCFSKTRQREYYFNSNTNESVWSIDELNKLNKKDCKLPKQSKLKLKAKDKLTINKVVSSPVYKRSKHVKIPVNDEEPMEIDDVIEKVYKIRKDTSNETNTNSNLTDLIEHNKNDITNKFIVVLDTNIFLSHLKSIKKMHLNEQVLVVVPWVVVQELDNCKNKKEYSENINKKAQDSIKFIMNVLQANSKGFLFENAQQSNESSNLIECYSPDDRILKCGLQIQIKHPQSEIILVTNDKNLTNKSLINNLKSTNFEEFQLKLTSNDFKVNKLEDKIQIDDLEIDNETHRNVYNKNFKKYFSKLMNLIDEFIISLWKQLIKCYYEKQKGLGNIWLETNEISAASSSKTSPDTLNYLVVNILKHFKRFIKNQNKTNEKSFQKMIECIQDNAKSYDNLNIFYSNNQVNSFDKLKTAIKISIELIQIFDLFNKEQFDDKISYLLTRLYLFNTAGYKLTNLYALSEQFNNDYQEIDMENKNSFEVFQPIWEKFYNFSLLSIDLLTNSNTKECIRSDFNIFFQFIISHSTIPYLKQFYEECLNELNMKNLNSLTLSMYILYKLFEIDVINETVIENESKKYYLIRNCLLSCFQKPSEAMKNGLLQLDEFKNRFQNVSLETVFQCLFE